MDDSQKHTVKAVYEDLLTIKADLDAIDSKLNYMIEWIETDFQDIINGSNNAETPVEK